MTEADSSVVRIVDLVNSRLGFAIAIFDIHCGHVPYFR